MHESAALLPDYGNWVSRRLVFLAGALTVILGAASFLVPWLALLALIPLAGLAYFAYARFLFSPAGGNVQAMIRNLVLENLNWDGKGRIIDIGCGNAPLTVSLAKTYPEAEVVGIDYWGQGWEYSEKACRKNAEAEGVADRVSFQRAGASALPFDDESFDAAVSNLVFHEVRDAKDKKEVIREALRVVKKGGRFAFQDLFLWKRIYGDVDGLLETMKTWGVESVEFTPTRDMDFIPQALKPTFMLGALGILHGKK